MKKLACLILFTLAVSAASALADDGNDAKPKTALGKKAAKRSPKQDAVHATGTLEPEEVVEVGAQVVGQVLAFGPDARDPNHTVDYDSEVAKGAVLARLDPTIYQARVHQAQATVRRAEAELKVAEIKLAHAERGKKLADVKGLVTADASDKLHDNYDLAQAGLDVHKAALEQARAGLQEAQVNLDQCTICSPIAGTIIDRRVSVGQTLSSKPDSQGIFLIAKDLKKLQVWASVKEADIARIHPGQTAHFTLDAFPKDRFQGKVEKVRLNATMTQNVVTYTVVVSVDNSTGKLLPYMTADVSFVVGER